MTLTPLRIAVASALAVAFSSSAPLAQDLPCSLPKSIGDNVVVAIVVEKGGAQPTVTVRGQADTTSLARIIVEPGSSPLYVLLSSEDGTVWRFEGQVDRVRQVVVIPAEIRDPDAIGQGWAGAGVLGVPKDVVTFTNVLACPIKYYGKTQRTRIIAEAVGTTSALAFGQSYPEGFSIPSGKALGYQRARDIVTTETDTYSVVEGEAPEPMKDSAGFGAGLSAGFTLKGQEDWWRTNGGIVQVNPEDVIAPGRVEAYEVLPGADGLRHLVETGVLARTESGYRLLQPLPRWPANLWNLQNLTFILPKGMPRPKGSPAPARVIEEP
jgi:hypothetical protein